MARYFLIFPPPCFARWGENNWGKLGGVDFSYCQNELLATNHQIVGKSLKLFQPNKNGNISYGTGNDSWHGKIDTDYHLFFPSRSRYDKWVIRSQIPIILGMQFID